MKSMSFNSIGVINKYHEYKQIFKLYYNNIHNNVGAAIMKDVEEYMQYYEKYSGAKLNKQDITYEIGYGARPNRLVFFASMGYNVYGIDMDNPLLSFNLKSIYEIYKTNGIERMFKSMIRMCIFDLREKKNISDFARQKGIEYRIELSRLQVGNAANVLMQENSLNLIYSDNVFEHIRIEDLKQIISNMYKWLKSGGIALIRPNIYTGISGGHLVEWYPINVDRNMDRRSCPWGHLIDDRFQPTGYLNKLTRRQYRELFQEYFIIENEIVQYPDLGRQYYNGKIMDSLKKWPEEELFSNQVLFVLRPKKSI